MTTYETPRDGDGLKICAWCGGPIKQAGVGRSRDYCRDTHKQYAYRARREQRLIAEALADARSVSSTDDSSGDSKSSVDETVAVPVPRPTAAPAGPELVAEELPPPTPAMLADLLAPPAATAQERPRPSIPLPPPGPRRGRRMLPPPPGAQQLALGGDDQEHDGDGSAGGQPGRALRRDPQG